MVVERKVGEEDGDLKMEIRLIDNSKPLINVYLFKQIDISLCNAIRRTIIRSIPVLAVEDVEIYTNESAHYDETVAHRLGLIPLVTDVDVYDEIRVSEELGSAKNEVRRVSDYVGSTRTVTIESAFVTTPSVNDTYQLLKESYMVYKGPGDTISGGTVAYNEFWIIDYITTSSPAHNTTGSGDTEMSSLPHTYSSSYGMWYHDRDENNNYSGNTQTLINLASIGSKARWFTESSNSFGKALSESMSVSRYPNDEIPKFNIKLNDNNEMITVIQKFLNRPSRWLKYWVYDGAELGGPMFTVAGENIVSFVLTLHRTCYESNQSCR